MAVDLFEDLPQASIKPIRSMPPRKDFPSEKAKPKTWGEKIKYFARRAAMEEFERIEEDMEMWQEDRDFLDELNKKDDEESAKRMAEMAARMAAQPRSRGNYTREPEEKQYDTFDQQQELVREARRSGNLRRHSQFHHQVGSEYGEYSKEREILEQLSREGKLEWMGN